MPLMILMEDGAGVLVLVDAAVVVTTETGVVADGAVWVLVLLALRVGGLRERL